MRYVGIDPSTKTGLVILNDDGSVHTAKEITTNVTDDPARFIAIAQQATRDIDIMDSVTIEGFSYGSKGAGVSTQYGIGWIIRTWLYQGHNDYTEITPSALKKFATGKGNAKKEDMILPIYKRWGFENDSDNIRDAYILAQIGRYLDGLEKPTKYQDDVLKAVQK